MKSFLYTLILLISTSVTTYGFRNPPDEIIDMGPAKPIDIHTGSMESNSYA